MFAAIVPSGDVRQSGFEQAVGSFAQLHATGRGQSVG